MKKKVIVALFTSLSIYSAHAQSVRYGLDLGANFTNIRGNGMKNTYDAGYQAGAYGEVSLNTKWTVEPEILVNVTNSKKADNFINYYNNSGYPNANPKVNLNYITVPVLLAYKVNKTVTINAGPQYSYLVFDNEDLLKANQNALKKSNVGVIAGAQFVLEGVRFYARYSLGLNNINDIDNRYKWYMGQIQAGFYIHLF